MKSSDSGVESWLAAADVIVVCLADVDLSMVLAELRVVCTAVGYFDSGTKTMLPLLELMLVSLDRERCFCLLRGGIII